MSQPSAEREFLKAINKFATAATSQHWAHEGSELESPFTIVGDSITATFRYQGDSAGYRLRFTAPLKKLRSIDHDLYLIMVFGRDQVMIYRNDLPGSGWHHWTTDVMLHLGLVESGETEQLMEDVLASWERLKQDREQ